MLPIRTFVACKKVFGAVSEVSCDRGYLVAVKDFGFKDLVEARVTIICSKFAEGQKYEGALRYVLAVGMTGGGGESTRGEFGGKRPELDSTDVES